MPLDVRLAVRGYALVQWTGFSKRTWEPFGSLCGDLQKTAMRILFHQMQEEWKEEDQKRMLNDLNKSHKYHP